MSSKHSLSLGFLLLLNAGVATFGLSLESGERTCQSNSCLHGQCVSLLLGYKCVCQTGWFGILCDSPDACDPNPCTRGICHNLLNSNKKFVCNCNAGYTGETCKLTKRPFRHNPRSKGPVGNRINTTTYPQLDEENCIPNPCANGECDNGNDGFQCTCKAGWTGRKCDTRNYCELNPCVNGACINGPSGYNCSCSAGWCGVNCDTRDYCDPNPCVNNGACVNGQSGPSCSCATGWSGNRCETRNHCDPSPCVHGSCSNGQSGFFCTCETNWAGTTCADLILQVGDY